MSFIIESEDIGLRNIEMNDAERIYNILNDPTSLEWMNEYKPKSMDEVKEMIDKYHKRTVLGKGYLLGIELKKENKLIGMIAIDIASVINLNAKFTNIIIDKRYRRKGYGTEAEKLALNYCFNELNLHSIHMWIVEENIASIKAARKAGFKEVGKLFKETYRHGTYHNLILFQALNPNHNETT